MSVKRKTKVFSFKGFDNAHYRATEQYAALVSELYNRATAEIAKYAAKGNYNLDKPFSFADYPKTREKVQEVINQLSANVEAVVEKGSRRQWLFANKKNDEFISSIMDTSKLSKARLVKYQDRNLDALKAFQGRKVDGMNLSQRVWKYTKQYQEQIEIGLDVGLGEGRSAAQLSRDLRQNLQNPNALFRRVRDKRGNLVLSKAAKAFHPGQGVYRSAYKNAMRLTRSEINMSYRESDWLRWQSLDFIVGFEVRRSNKEPKCKCKLCERLVGRYPKTFKFKGWHPQCLCHAIPIIQDADSYKKQEEADLRSALYGTPKTKVQASNTVIDFPDEFKAWASENADAQSGWRNTPYFVRDNFKGGLLSEGLKYIPKASKKVKTDSEKADIQTRWNVRVATNKYADLLNANKAEYAEVPSLSEWIRKIEKAIQEGVSLDRVDLMVKKLNSKVKVKKAWEDRKENNYLSTVLVNVPELKAQFGASATKAVFKAVQDKLAYWESKDPSLYFMKKKLEYEVDWVEKNKKYETWKAAQDAYKKKLSDVDYKINKLELESGASHSFEFAKTTKSAKVKALASELKLMLENNAPIGELSSKKTALDMEVARLEAAKAARQAKRIFGDQSPVNWEDESMYSKQRKDAAMWEKSAKGSDKKLREVCSALWKEATDHEKLSAHRYTSGSSYINEPLRNIEYLGKYKGVYDSKKDTDALTSLVSRSRYKFDIWVQRGDGMIALKKFGLDMNNITPEAIKALVGKEGIEPAFWSCGSFKGGGFASSEIIFNIYCPRGTQGLYMEPFSYFGHGVNGGKGMNCSNGLKWDGTTAQKAFGDESEYLLQRGTKFRVTKVESGAGRWFIDLEVVGQIK